VAGRRGREVTLRAWRARCPPGATPQT
jgi:hypothetical protein